MATITFDTSTKGKWLVRAIDDNGEDIEKYCYSREEARTIAGIEYANQLIYFGQFRKIDGIDQHPDGLSFREWLKKRYKNISN